ncbi:hypothetical protein [Fulvivirga ligni]|uniref:hypothetical protein n=1 Tax=Fulvivirga ligni TaxID=2904246 RepID=UPI001F337567|nr:hypothetical protein [Fulvivirga ligni]UII24261.1 hypothetical protein LVD16_13650 [Fulvivirga ligni]
MCVLHVTCGKTLIKPFLDATEMPIYQFHERGDTIKIGLNKNELYEDSGFSCEISDRNWNDFEGQIDDLKQFLHNYHSDLVLLKTHYEIKTWIVDLPYFLRLNGEFFSQSDYLDPEIMKLLSALDIGLELSLYPPEN